MLALLDNIGFGELMLVLVVALLVFGKRLPEVAGQAGSQLAKFKRSLEDLRHESGIDNEVRRMQKEIRNVRDVIPRDLSIGDMARIASTEMEKRLQANEQADAGAAPKPAGSTVAEAPPRPDAMPDATAGPAREATSGPSGHASAARSDDATAAAAGSLAARERAHAAGTPPPPAPVLGAPLDEDLRAGTVRDEPPSSVH
jgi:sec-independent protein translocase protein TatA